MYICPGAHPGCIYVALPLNLPPKKVCSLRSRSTSITFSSHTPVYMCGTYTYTCMPGCSNMYIISGIIRALDASTISAHHASTIPAHHLGHNSVSHV